MSVKKSCIFLLFSTVTFSLIFLFLKLTDVRTVHSFQALTDRFFQEEVTSSTLTLHYTLRDPQVYGISDIPVRYNATTSDVSTAADYLQQLTDLDPSCLPLSDQITYDILLYLLNQDLSAQNFSLYAEPLGATIGIQAQLPVLLCEYRFENIDDIHTYLQLLSTTDQYFSSLLSYERQKAAAGLFMPDSCADDIIHQCSTFIEKDPSLHLLVTVFNHKTGEADFLTESEKKDLIQQNLDHYNSVQPFHSLHTDYCYAGSLLQILLH